LLVGVPGSGKTTYAKNYIEKNPAIHLSSDTIRKELYGDESIQGNPAEVFSLMQERAISALYYGCNVLYDATNITRKDRASIIGICPKFTKVEAHIVWAPIETCIERDIKRERTVGKAVIDKMLKRFQAPYYDEGIDEIKVIMPDKFDSKEYYTNTMRAMDIPHDNHHHTLNIKSHCEKAFEIIQCNTKSGELLIAAGCHDIGKPYVKSFTDSKGNPCDEAHYYQHQCVGAYDALFFDLGNKSDDDILEISCLVNLHMEPFSWQKLKTQEKYKNLWGEDMFNKIMLIHDADMKSSIKIN
jgi:predicted kinase